MKTLNVTARLRDLIDSYDNRELNALYVDSSLATVRSLVVITDIEDISSVAPDTVILLTPDVAQGGWMIAAALRYAWERRACALIAPEQASNNTVIALAKRLSVSFFTTKREIIPLALELAIHIGVAGAGSLTRVQDFVEQIERASHLEDVMEITSVELGGAPVQIESLGTITVASPRQHHTEPSHDGDGVEATAPDKSIQTSRASSPIFPASVTSDLLVTYVAESQQNFAGQLLRAAAPTARGILLEAQLAGIRASLPLISTAALAGITSVEALTEPAVPTLIDGLKWPISGGYQAVCILTQDHESLGSAVHGIWAEETDNCPLARFQDGWIAFLPFSDQNDAESMIERLSDKFEKLHRMGLRVGVSTVHSGPDQAIESVREAWLAARVAGEEVSDTLLRFSGIHSRLIPRIMSKALAERLLSSLYPEFTASPQSAELATAVQAYLNCHGSVSSAATELGVHRNTMQLRLRRAIELGLPLGDPSQLLPTHVILAAAYRQ